MLALVRESAREDKGQLQPPHSKVQLDPRGSAADHAIVQEIQSRFPDPDRDATTQWDQCLRKIKKQLQAGKTVELPAVGHFEQSGAGAIDFVTQKLSGYFNPVAFGQPIEPATSTAAHTQAPEEAPPLSPLTPENGSSNKKRWWYVLVPLLVLVVGYLAYRYFSSPSAKDPASDPSITPTEGTAPPLSTTPGTDSAAARQGTTDQPVGKVQASDSIHFAVIYRVYRAREDADKQYQRMRNWGHDVVLYTPDSGLFMLGYPYYERPADTARRLKEIEATYGGNPFVFYPKK